MGFGGMMAYNNTVQNSPMAGSGSGFNFSPYAGAITSVLGSLLGTSTNVAAIKAKSNAIIKQIDAESNNYIFETSVVTQQRIEASRELGDIMSDTGLKAVEAEAQVRARNAMRGVSGSSVNQSSTAVAMKANLANADAIRKYENTDITLLRRNLANRMNFENKTSQLASGIASPSSAGLSAISGAVQGFTQGTQMYNMYDWFSKNSKGVS